MTKVVNTVTNENVVDMSRINALLSRLSRCLCTGTAQRSLVFINYKKWSPVGLYVLLNNLFEILDIKVITTSHAQIIGC